MNSQLNFKQITKNAGFLLTVFMIGWLFYGCSSAQTGNKGQRPTSKSKSKSSQTGMSGMNMPGMNMAGMNMGGGVKKESSSSLTLSPVAMKLADVATAPVVRKTAVKRIRMPGKVMVDEQKISAISANFSGRVEKLFVNFTGAYVKKGEKLASIYSPELVTAQKELLQAYQMRNSDSALYRAARQKLKHWEISDQQIEQIIQTGKPQAHFIIRARQSGYVTKRNIAVGDYVKAGKPMFKIADLSTVWVIFQANENELSGLDTGDQVNFRVSAYPGRTFEAKVTYIGPFVHNNRRTVSVRTEVSNKDGLLKPNMLAQGTVSVTLHNSNPVLQVPESAVLWTGKHSIVWVKKPDSDQPIFEARKVTLGPSLGNSYVILKGLKAGEQVVVQGNFMIDAAAQLAGIKSMMNPEPGKGGNTSMPGMPGMNMGQMNMGGNKKSSNSQMKMDMNNDKKNGNSGMKMDMNMNSDSSKMNMKHSF